MGGETEAEWLVAPTLGMDFRWRCAYYLEAMQIRFTSCSSLIYIAMAGLEAGS